MAGWHGPPPEVRDALWAAWPENSFSRKMRWHEAVLSQHPWEDEEKGFVVEVLWSGGGLTNWVPLAHIKPRGGLGETAQTAMARFGPPAPEPDCYVRLPGGPDSPPPKRARVDEALAAPAPAPPRPQRSPPPQPAARQLPVAAPRPPADVPPPPRRPADVPPPPRRPAAVPPPSRRPAAAPRQPRAAAPPPQRAPPVVRPAPPRPPAQDIQEFFVPPQEDVERLGEGAGGSLLPHEIDDLPTVPSERAYDVYYLGEEPRQAEPLVRFAPIIPNSGLHRCAARIARLMIGRSLLTDPTPRGHDGGASEYRMVGLSRVYRHRGVGEGQKNKQTEGHLGLIKAKLAKLRRELEDQGSKSGGGGGERGFDWRPFRFLSAKSTTLKKRCGPSSASRRTCGRLLHHRPGRRTAPSLLPYLRSARRRTTRPSSTAWPPLEDRAGPSRRGARLRRHRGRGSAAWSPRGRARGPRRTSRARRRASWPCRGCGRRRRRPRTRCCSTGTRPK